MFMNSVWEQCMFLKPKVHNIKKNVLTENLSLKDKTC